MVDGGWLDGRWGSRPVSEITICLPKVFATIELVLVLNTILNIILCSFIFAMIIHNFNFIIGESLPLLLLQRGI